MTIEVLFQKVIEKYNTTNPIEIAQKAGVKIEYGNWFPVTYGEYNRLNRTITINKQADIKQNIILTHELGHFLIHEFKICLSRKNEEKLVADFVECFHTYLSRV